MPLFLIPLALSIFSAGAGIFSQIQANNQLEQAGQQAITDQQAKNTTAQIDQYATYIRTLDNLNAEQANAALQATQTQVQTQRTISLSLYATAALLLILSLIALSNSRLKTR
ncbi:hypothetical protein GO755_33490 [Spirosoma sp. HMF4905]|uniref:Methyl-accepting chemotaxis protein n=1 Tax=Spirosoma arboris TaxID=2682092 RepID=A0A7K1SMG3_9BACT|nr:hypothetical protein [Spirosoma arboris]MVM34990.1 hypothetical protein [Spirosoma arboris]